MKSLTFISILIFCKVVRSSRWSVTTPWSLSAVKGSCAKIPCRFDYPTNGRNPQGMCLKWSPHLYAPGVSVIYDSRDADNMHHDYRGRAELAGDFIKKQCSLRLKDIRESDGGEYYFILKIMNSQDQIEGYGSKTPVNLSILNKSWISVPGELIAGKPVHLTCSVTSSCPSANPELTWIQDEDNVRLLQETKNSKYIDNRLEGSWAVSTTFIFTPSPDHNGKKLGCQLVVDGVVGSVQETLTLHIQNVLEKPSFNSSIVIVEGTSLLLYCRALGDQPVNLTLVRVVTEISRSSTGELKHTFHNISSEDDGEYYCVAENNLSTANRSTQISVQFKPTIVWGPTCTRFESGFHCTCSVRAKPPANITWSVNGRNITGNMPGLGVNARSMNNSLVQSSLTLTHPTATGHHISCVAWNEHGVRVGKYQICSTGSFWKIAMSIRTAAAVLILIAIIVLVMKEIDSHGAKTRRETLLADGQHPSNRRKV